MAPNVYELDAADLDETNGTIVPGNVATDAEGDSIEEDSYAFSRRYKSIKHEWAIKIVNDADQDVDATPVLSTSDDEALEEYDTVDALTETVGQGDPPTNVEILESDLVAAYLGIELTPAAAAEGTVTVVFNSRRTGGRR